MNYILMKRPVPTQSGFECVLSGEKLLCFTNPAELQQQQQQPAERLAAAKELPNKKL